MGFLGNLGMKLKEKKEIDIAIFNLET